MKLRDEFIAHETKDEAFLVPSGAAEFSGIMKGNRTLGAILKLLREDISEEKLISEMEKTYEAPRQMIAEDVQKVLAELRRIGALEE